MAGTVSSAHCAVQVGSYMAQRRSEWPERGRHILAQFDEETIVVYQAFRPDIAEYAVTHGKFGGPEYSFTRMTWIKTNFMWMMYRSGWGQKRDQERTLAILLSRKGFEELLKGAKGVGITLEKHQPDDVRIQWDPDHCPKGEKLERRAIQLGLKGTALQKFHQDYIQRIADISEFVDEQRQFVDNGALDKLLSPIEKVYVPSDKEICRHILLEGYDTNEGIADATEAVYPLKNITDENAEACCSGKLQSLIDGRFAGSDTKENVIVCLGGAFNPVHTRHVAVLKAAIGWLHKNTHYRVVAARLAVAPDGYVKQKCKKTKALCIKAQHRLRLCQLTCDGHDLIQSYHSTVGSALECGQKVRREENWGNVKTAVVVGADRAVSRGGGKWTRKSKCVTVCVGRKGTTDAVKQAYLADLSLHSVEDKDFFIADTEIDDVSSTEIRRKLQSVNLGISDVYAKGNYQSCSSTSFDQERTVLETQGPTEEDTTTAQQCSTMKPAVNKQTSSDVVIGELVQKGWIDNKAGAYLFEHLSDLYH
ncbi:uncharacterized protein LOC127838795 [Dreissena polymorpha]|uniref:uncharacterized protein LOC127838795 n=1 Tax=Dreissena polymorpha TaxID=45954 RepID=UPI0022651959|nr:uncharacterized protein LOC127838795 [Dreissena polymorpha]